LKSPADPNKPATLWLTEIGAQPYSRAQRARLGDKGVVDGLSGNDAGGDAMVGTETGAENGCLNIRRRDYEIDRAVIGGKMEENAPQTIVRIYIIGIAWVVIGIREFMRAELGQTRKTDGRDVVPLTMTRK